MGPKQQEERRVNGPTLAGFHLLCAARAVSLARPLGGHSRTHTHAQPDPLRFLAFSCCVALSQDYFNDNPQADNLGKVKSQIEDVKGVMVENIEKVLARGEKIELLVDKTEQLNSSAKKFQRASKSLKSAMWWKNVKMWLLIIAIAAIIIWLIASFACGFNFDKCKSK